jgi:hypothetical protein
VSRQHIASDRLDVDDAADRRLNPTWDEKMLFHVRRYEDNYNIQFALLDWDKVSGNDFIGSSTIPLQDLIKDAPRPDEETGLYGSRVDGKHEMREFAVSLTDMQSAWSPVLILRTVSIASHRYTQGVWVGKPTLPRLACEVSNWLVLYELGMSLIRNPRSERNMNRMMPFVSVSGDNTCYNSIPTIPARSPSPN